MKKTKVLLGMTVSGAICLSLVQIVFSSMFATDGIEMNSMQAQKETLVRENEILKEKVYQASSLTTISQEATQMGYTQDSKSRLSITNPLPIALNQ